MVGTIHKLTVRAPGLLDAELFSDLFHRIRKTSNPLTQRRIQRAMDWLHQNRDGPRFESARRPSNSRESEPAVLRVTLPLDGYFVDGSRRASSALHGAQLA